VKLKRSDQAQYLANTHLEREEEEATGENAAIVEERNMAKTALSYIMDGGFSDRHHGVMAYQRQRTGWHQ